MQIDVTIQFLVCKRRAKKYCKFEFMQELETFVNTRVSYCYDSCVEVFVLSKGC